MAKKKTGKKKPNSSIKKSMHISKGTSAEPELTMQEQERNEKKSRNKDKINNPDVARNYASTRLTSKEKQMTDGIVKRLNKRRTSRKITLSRLLRATFYALEYGDISEEKMRMYIERYT